MTCTFLLTGPVMPCNLRGMNRSTFAKRFGKAVAKARTKRHMTMGEVAERVGLKKQNLWVVENGLSVPRLDTAVKMAKGLSVSLDSLLPD